MIFVLSEVCIECSRMKEWTMFIWIGEGERDRKVFSEVMLRLRFLGLVAVDYIKIYVLGNEHLEEVIVYTDKNSISNSIEV